MLYTDHAKVSQFDPAAGGVTQEDVLWLEVPVDKTKGVQMGQSATQLGHHPLTAVPLHTPLERKGGDGQQKTGVSFIRKALLENDRIRPGSLSITTILQVQKPRDEDIISLNGRDKCVPQAR